MGSVWCARRGSCTRLLGSLHFCVLLPRACIFPPPIEPPRFSRSPWPAVAAAQPDDYRTWPSTAAESPDASSAVAAEPQGHRQAPVTGVRIALSNARVALTARRSPAVLACLSRREDEITRWQTPPGRCVPGRWNRSGNRASPQAGVRSRVVQELMAVDGRAG
jgi:hypothetical protein